jgi:hypothetical protein
MTVISVRDDLIVQASIELSKARRQAEVLSDRLERMEQALQRIAEWSRAYPLEVFPEPTKEYYAEAARVLEANGMTLDRLFAAAMRHVIAEVGKIADEALKAG